MVYLIGASHGGADRGFTVGAERDAEISIKMIKSAARAGAWSADRKRTIDGIKRNDKVGEVVRRPTLYYR